MGIHQRRNGKEKVESMTSYNLLIPLLIILGWVATWCIANIVHRKNDRVNLINKKNDMLRNLKPKAIMYWKKDFNDTKKYLEIFIQINQIISIYEEMENDHKDAKPQDLGKLRRTITLDIESKEEFDAKEISDRRRDISDVIDVLRFQPSKFKKFLNLV